MIAAVEGIQWAGVNTNGCIAVITVEEESADIEPNFDTGVSSIVAGRDALITSCVATNGALLCAPGQVVKRGDVLVSGYTDCGLKIQAGHADGEIYGYTIHEKTAFMPLEYKSKIITGQIGRSYSLLLGKNCINLWKNSRISGASCDKIYEEYYVVLPGGFVLPVGFRIETCQGVAEESLLLDKSISYPLASGICDEMVHNDMICGRILQISSDTQILSDGFLMDRKYFCEEMIGRRQTEEIIDSYG